MYKRQVREEIVAIGLNHHLVTKHTSLVAVEQVVSRPQGESLTSSAIPTNLPKGWVMEDIWAQRKQWAGEVKAMRNTIDKAREKGLVIAKAETNGKASLSELRRMQEQLRIEQARQLAEAGAGTYATTSTAATAPKRIATAQGPGALPQTSTGAALLLLIGLLLLGLAFVVRPRRWKFA